MNSGMFGVGLAMTMLLSLQKIAQGTMSVGDLAAVNAMLLQLQIPFNYIGYTYQVFITINITTKHPPPQRHHD